MVKKNMEFEKLILTEDEVVALLQLLIPMMKMRIEDNVLVEIANHVAKQVLKGDFSEWIIRERNRKLRKNILIGPLEKAFLLKMVSDDLLNFTIKESYRHNLETILRKLKSGKHPLSWN